MSSYYTNRKDVNTTTGNGRLIEFHVPLEMGVSIHEVVTENRRVDAHGLSCCVEGMNGRVQDKHVQGTANTRQKRADTGGMTGVNWCSIHRL